MTSKKWKKERNKKKKKVVTGGRRKEWGVIAEQQTPLESIAQKQRRKIERLSFPVSILFQIKIIHLFFFRVLGFFLIFFSISKSLERLCYVAPPLSGFELYILDLKKIRFFFCSFMWVYLFIRLFCAWAWPSLLPQVRSLESPGFAFWPKKMVNFSPRFNYRSQTQMNFRISYLLFFLRMDGHFEFFSLDVLYFVRCSFPFLCLRLHRATQW